MRVIFPSEIEEANASIENSALELAWPQMREAIIDSNPGLSIIEEECKADEIREWLSFNPNAVQNVQKLDLSNIGLKVLPPEIVQFVNLSILNLSHNQLTSIPAEIGNLGNLSSLNLSHNQLTSIPAEIGNLGNLRSLGLSNNQLTSLPAEIENLGNLGRLNLEYNLLISLPPNINQLGNLVHLYISKNPISAFIRFLPEGIFPPYTSVWW